MKISSWTKWFSHSDLSLKNKRPESQTNCLSRFVHRIIHPHQYQNQKLLSSYGIVDSSNTICANKKLMRVFREFLHVQETTGNTQSIDFKKILSHEKGANEEEKLSNFLTRWASVIGTTPGGDKIDQFSRLIQELPEHAQEVPSQVYDIDSDAIEQLIKSGTNVVTDQDFSSKGKDHYEVVLSELDRLQARLGGAPNYQGKRPPPVDAEDMNRTFLGVPRSSVRDWFRMSLHNKWHPRIFWTWCASRFNVSQDLCLTHYEYTAQAIQRFGLLTENKQYLVDLLKTNPERCRSEFSRITGLAWHPAANAKAVEEEYFTIVDAYLTKGFEAARCKGDDALIEYFSAFEGVCFEARARNLEQAYGKYSTEGAELLEIPDYDLSSSPAQIFEREATTLANRLSRCPTIKELTTFLKEKNIFSAKLTGDGSDASMSTFEKFHIWCLSQQPLYALDFYTEEQFLEVELEILKKKQDNVNADDFIHQISERLQQHEVLVYANQEQQEQNVDPNEFSLDRNRIVQFFNKSYQSEL